MHVDLLRQLDLKNQNCEPLAAMYVPTISVQLRHTKLPSFWDSHVDALAEVWKMLVVAIEMIEGFVGVVSMILLMLPATRTPGEAAKNDLKNGW